MVLLGQPTIRKSQEAPSPKVGSLFLLLLLLLLLFPPFKMPYAAVTRVLINGLV